MIKRAVLAVAGAALRTRAGAGNTELRLVANRRLIPLATPRSFWEYEDVLKRPEQRIAHGLTLEMVRRVLGRSRGFGRTGRSTFSLAAPGSRPER